MSTTFPKEIEAETSEHMMLSLIMAIFVFYATTSLGLYFHKTLSQESFSFLFLSLVLLLWTFRANVIDFISPALLRLFGAGGQGYLHLLSLWFVDPRDLTFVGVFTRVLAGSYTAILAAIFFIPLLFAVCIYLMNLYDALTPQVQQQQSSATSATPFIQHQEQQRPETVDAHREPRQRQAPSVSISSEAPLVFERPSMPTNAQSEIEERWLLNEFDMDAFLVLCPLGKGVTSSVVLAKVDVSNCHQIDATNNGASDHHESQAGSLWANSISDATSIGASPKAIPVLSPYTRIDGEEKNNTEAIRQDGSFWGGIGGGGGNKGSNVLVIHPRQVPSSSQLQTDGLVASSSSLSSLFKHNSSNSVDLDLHDRVLMDLETSSSFEDDKHRNGVIPSALKYLDPAHDSKIFLPGGGPQSVILSKIAADEGGWRKLEPTREASIFRSADPAKASSTLLPQQEPMSRQTSTASSLGGMVTSATTTTSTGTQVPSIAASPPMKRALLDSHMMSKMKKNSQSLTALSELAGEMPAGDGDNWWRPLQWLDEVQRKKSGMDEVFAAAPGLAESQLSLSDLAKLEKEGGAGTSDGGGDGEWKKRSFGSSTMGDSRSNEERDPQQHHLGGLSTIRRPNWGSFNKSPKLVRFSNFPSALSLTESELMNLDDPNADDDDHMVRIRVLPCGLEDLPDLVAIKVMRKTDIDRMGMRKTVENERRALAMCASPFICNMFGAFQDRRWAYLLLEPVPAGDLAGLLEQRQVMFEDEARFYLGCLLLALEHLHAKGIACLDVKPENLLLDQYGYCKLCDFGIAKIFPPLSDQQSSSKKKSHSGSQTPHWEFVGTPEYMAPEVVCRDPIAQGLPGVAGPDLWACGILLFELLSGETPFAGDTNTEVVGRIQKFVVDEREAKRKRMSRYQRWTSRVNLKRAMQGETDDDFLGSNDDDATSTTTGQAEEEEDLPASPELDRVFAPIARASPSARDMIRRLLRSNPRRRMGCRAPTGESAKVVMAQEWFTKSRFDWAALRRREMKAPFVPNPLTLAPPFRGEEVEVDITRTKPLTMMELQRCQNYLKGGGFDDGVEDEGVGDSPSNTWKGFLPVQTVPSSQGSAGTKSQEFMLAVQHVQKLFKDDID